METVCFEQKKYL